MAGFPTLASSFIKYLDERHITQEENALLKLAPVDYETAATLLGYKPVPPITTFVAIPYFDIDGTTCEYGAGRQFLRFRRDNYDGEGKYLQARDSGNRAYLPQIEGIDWMQISKDVSVPVVFVEGEHKAIAMCQAGVPTIAVAGCNSWTTKTHTLVPPLDQIEWAGRQTPICFDCDKESTPDVPFKKQVDRAIHQFASHLYTLNAKPSVLVLARTSKWAPGHKMGPDDYLFSGGSIDELLKTSYEPVTDADLAELFKRFVVSRNGPCIIDSVTGMRYNFPKFRELERHRKRKTEKSFKYVADDFIESRNKPEVDREVFDPRHEYGYLPELRVFNWWEGLSVEPKENVEYAEAWNLFLDRLWGKYKDDVKCWLAHMVQRPYERTNIALACVSRVQGVGKSMFSEIMINLIGPRHATSISYDRLAAQFNSQLANRLLISVEEADGLFKGKESLVKDFITNPKLMIENKGINTITLDNYARVMLNSNNILFSRLDRNERRWLVHIPRIKDEDVRGDWGKWTFKWNPILKSSTGCAAILADLLKVDISGWDHTIAPLTDDLRLVAEGSVGGVDREAQNMYDQLADAGGRMITTAAMTKDFKKQETKLVELLLSSDGGRFQHRWKEDGATKAGHIWWIDSGCALETGKDVSGNPCVVAGQVDADLRKHLLLVGAQVFGGVKKFD